MKKVLTLKDSINVGKHKKKPISEIVEEKKIFKYIKDGYEFADDVLEAAHIKKSVRDEKIRTVFVEHKKRKHKEYQKDTESVKNILKSINTIDEQNLNEKSFYTQNDDEEQDILTLIEEEQKDTQEECQKEE